MEPKYQEWINGWLAKHPAGGYATCKEATAEMVKAFPELTRVAGHVDSAWGKRAHWWCVAAEGIIVDPTQAQFPESSWLTYEKWEPGMEVRVGKCMNCGAEIWKPVQSLEEDPGHHSVCSDSCDAELVADLNG